MTPTPAAQAVERVRGWLFDRAFPFWSTVGVDPGFGFVERLDLRARPDRVGFKRLRVQARQVYVFCQAEALGWRGGLEAARQGYAFMTAHGRLEGGGFARTLGRERGVIDPALDLYDQAFALFALAWMRRLTGEAEPLRLAEQAWAAVEARLTHPSGEGFRAASDAGDEGLQNPHMHLLEAALALAEAGGGDRWLEAAGRIAGLFERRLFDPATGTLAERFDPAWRRVEPAVLEPGHQFEWIWLLDRLRRMTGRKLKEESRGLWEFASTQGVDRATELAWDGVTSEGEVVKPSHRLWAQTELLKARLTRLENGETAEASAAIRTIEAVFRNHIDPAPEGCWRDQLDAGLAWTDDRIPASSLYHLALAFSEVLRLADRLEAAA